jgi:hypothetical protein
VFALVSGRFQTTPN